ncbi:hypothetical protein HJB80_08665 [Rhizobium lentis]|uniref:hypothetical protein n=1 Tax=Rhizobium lentis TaxID=1138194 RepID=UPI001C832D9C|nr:hypothetical protein [Rhizobium lentis]MBX5132729.1 hypothetical protein [Rhizobium lentis]
MRSEKVELNFLRLVTDRRSNAVEQALRYAANNDDKIDCEIAPGVATVAHLGRKDREFWLSQAAQRMIQCIVGTTMFLGICTAPVVAASMIWIFGFTFCTVACAIVAVLLVRGVQLRLIKLICDYRDLHNLYCRRVSADAAPLVSMCAMNICLLSNKGVYAVHKGSENPCSHCVVFRPFSDLTVSLKDNGFSQDIFIMDSTGSTIKRLFFYDQRGGAEAAFRTIEGFIISRGKSSQGTRLFPVPVHSTS